MQGFRITGIKDTESLQPDDTIILNIAPLTDHEIDSDKWDVAYTEVADLDKAYPDSDQRVLIVNDDIDALQAHQAEIAKDVAAANQRYTDQMVPIQEAAAQKDREEGQFKDKLATISFDES